MAVEKMFIISFDQNINSKLSAIESEQGLIGSRNGHAGRGEKFARKFFIEAGWILDRIIQRDFAKTMEGLLWRLFGKVQSQTRKEIDRSEGASPFLLHQDIRIGVAAFRDSCFDLGAGFVAEICPSPVITPQ